MGQPTALHRTIPLLLVLRGRLLALATAAIFAYALPAPALAQQHASPAIQERSVDEGTIAEIEVLQGRADEEYENGNHEAAERLYRSALARTEAAFGKDSLEALAALDTLAWFHQSLLQYDQAELRTRVALVCKETMFGPDHPLTVDSVNTLAELSQAQARFAEAEALYLRALEATRRQAGDTSLEAILPMERLALFYETQGRYAEAEPLLARVLEERRAAFGAENPDTLIALNNLAFLYVSQGRYGEAEPLLLQAVEVQRRLFGEDDPGTLTSLENLADLRVMQGRYGEAEPLMQQVLNTRRLQSGDGDPKTLGGINNLASLYMAQGRFSDAEAQFDSLLASDAALADPDHPVVLAALGNLGLVGIFQERYDKAEATNLRAVEAHQRVYGTGHPATLTAMHNLAYLYNILGRYEEAEQIYLAVLEEKRRVLGADHPETLVTINRLAWVHENQGRNREASEAYWQVLGERLRVLPENHPRLAESYEDLASFANDRLQSGTQAIYFYKKGVNVLQGVRQNMAELDGSTQRAFLDRWRDSYLKLQELLIDQGRFAEAEQVGRMFKDVEYTAFVRGATDREAGDMLALTSSERAWDAQLAGWLETPNRLAAEREALITRQRGGEQLSALEERQLADLDQAHGQAYDAFMARAEEWANTVWEVENASIKEEAARLNLLQSTSMQGTIADIGSDVALLQAVAFEDSLHLFLITPDALDHVEVPVGRAQLFETIAKAREVIDDARYDGVVTAEGRKASLQAPLGQLYQWLVAPMEDELAAAGTKTLMLNLQGQIRYVPFAALWDGQGWLAQRYRFAFYTPSVRTRYQPSAALTRGQAFGLSQATPGFSALENVPEELRSIVGADGDGGILQGDFKLDNAFTREALQQGLSSPEPVMHIATHFHINPGDENASFLVLGDGSRVTLSEMNRSYKFTFRGVELLTLSACQTALGGDGTGMEIDGLGALAQNKGASSVMATLWQIADETTPVLMRHFYSGLAQQNLSKAEALQQAQIAMIEGSNTSDPFHWAPFVLMGNWM